MCPSLELIIIYHLQDSGLQIFWGRLSLVLTIDFYDFYWTAIYWGTSVWQLLDVLSIQIKDCFLNVCVGCCFAFQKIINWCCLKGFPIKILEISSSTQIEVLFLQIKPWNLVLVYMCIITLFIIIDARKKNQNCFLPFRKTFC